MEIELWCEFCIINADVKAHHIMAWHGTVAGMTLRVMEGRTISQLNLKFKYKNFHGMYHHKRIIDDDCVLVVNGGGGGGGGADSVHDDGRVIIQIWAKYFGLVTICHT